MLKSRLKGRSHLWGEAAAGLRSDSAHNTLNIQPLLGCLCILTLTQGKQNLPILPYRVVSLADDPVQMGRAVAWPPPVPSSGGGGGFMLENGTVLTIVLDSDFYLKTREQH